MIAIGPRQERRTVLFTRKVPSARRGQDPRQIPSSQAKAFYSQMIKLSQPRRKREVNLIRIHQEKKIAGYASP